MSDVMHPRPDDLLNVYIALRAAENWAHLAPCVRQRGERAYRQALHWQRRQTRLAEALLAPYTDTRWERIARLHQRAKTYELAACAVLRSWLDVITFSRLFASPARKR